MSWRTVIISSTAKLDYQMGYLVIRKDDVTKIHLSEIETVMIESTSVSLTAALLCELTKKKIKVIFCDEKRNPSSELISYYGAHDTSLKVRNQIAWTDDIKNMYGQKLWWRKYGNRRCICSIGNARKQICFISISTK